MRLLLIALYKYHYLLTYLRTDEHLATTNTVLASYVLTELFKLLNGSQRSSSGVYRMPENRLGLGCEAEGGGHAALKQNLTPSPPDAEVTSRLRNSASKVPRIPNRTKK